MPLSGLLVAANGALNDLLQEQALTSWKVVGDANATVTPMQYLTDGLASPISACVHNTPP